MHRESVYACTYTTAEEEYVAHVRAWDAREAAELFARELELEGRGEPVPVDAIRVRPVPAGVGAVLAA